MSAPEAEDGYEPAKLGIAGALTRAFIQSPLTPLLMLASLAMGLIALMSVPREEEPQISVPMVNVIVQAPGLVADDVVNLVTEPLEGILRAIPDVEHVYSQTHDYQTMLTARFVVGTSSDAAILRVHERVRANMDRIPVGIPEPLIIGRGIDDVAIVTLTLSAADGSEVGANALSDIARELRGEIQRIEDVGLSYIVGEASEAIRVTPDPERLALFGVTLQQLAQKVAGANSMMNAGTLYSEGDEITLLAGQSLVSPTEIAGLLLTTRDERPVYVGDVADISFVEDMSDHRVTQITRGEDGELDRRPAVTLAFAKRAGANAVTVAEEILHRVEALEGSLIPDSVQVEVTRDYGETAAHKADKLLLKLFLATLSIVVLTLLTIGWRESIVVAIVIPVTILLALFAAWAMGYTLNRVSLFALIFSIGILVDDAIVVIENIARHWAMGDGRSRIRAAIDGVAEVGNPTIVATLTVVAALLPMLFVSGLMGPYMSPIPAVASAAMILSFFIAVMVTPWLMIKISGKAPVHGHDGAHGGTLGRIFRAVARPVLKSRPGAALFLLLTIVLSFGSLGLLYTQHVTVKLLPYDNKDELAVVFDLPEGSALEDTDAVALAAAEIAMGLPEVRSVETYAGTAAPFNFNGLVRHYFMRQSPHMGDIQINLGDRERSSHDIALDLRERLAALDLPEGTRIRTVEPPPGPPVMATLLAEVYGPDTETRRAVAREVRGAFESVDFIVDIDDTFATPARRMRLLLSPDDLEFYGVTEADVLNTIATLNGAQVVGYSHRGLDRDPLPIVIGPDRGDRVLDESFLSTPVPANLLPGARGVVELGDVVEVIEESASPMIYRRNGRPAEMVMGELAGRFEAPLYGIIAVGEALDSRDWGDLPQPEILLNGQPEDESHPSVLWDGEWEVTWVTFRDMGAAFGVALLAIYVLVVAQFGSFRLPLVVLTPVPLTFLGIMGGHWLWGAPFSATSMIGFIALAGIIVRNSILLVDFIRNADTEGKTQLDILLEAGAIRFKPILLTALAAMFGAIVILSDPIFQGLALSLLFGLLTSTLLTVLVIPAIYRVLKT
ncbi:efflux RND transporter permease subunit [Roseibacterium beibuensis]|uniref:Efflux RND transporter permease subunit n=1 Tax=[Roseibacterium] beibuensis TaxID=1193142 RepID=A0ABP9LFX0_9RHOB|nr:efflux RND transporter permease subunit [Roseibacterium beibuensis]MCS6623275.1 efflux RND transporter permease subunit [Roseibacterium beibuensis]